jgi:hypothetical protein
MVEQLFDFSNRHKDLIAGHGGYSLNISIQLRSNSSVSKNAGLLRKTQPSYPHGPYPRIKYSHR